MTATVEAHTIVEEALQLFGRKLDNKGIVLRRGIDPEIRVRVVTGELRQVVSNLLSNAIDAVSQGGQVTVRVGRTERAGRTMGCILVSDDGCGMSRELLKGIFEPFQSTKGSKGTGLGLFISKELVERYGASCWRSPR
ncbi:MAG TPA: HAMP domain-containing sensor histidine kinase [Acidobacteriaceae bacterium]|nr:HAMP domain-containing sensor histidine kinase [Acidobacteriaceae bacterium]